MINVEKAKKFAVEHPKSDCTCGHTGDGANSQHEGVGIAGDGVGHGSCKVSVCNCRKFVWFKFTDAFKKAMGIQKAVRMQ